MNESMIQQINQSIDDLIQTCETLRKENYTLRQMQKKAESKHSKLLGKQHTAQAKLESLLLKLKTEQG
ncbi:MAG: hypothetical protein HY559_02925 [Gammaproteobacteria bacterium]|nr:hypothetical protein [Gammaproteobacteria bacterium]